MKKECFDLEIIVVEKLSMSGEVHSDSRKSSKDSEQLTYLSSSRNVKDKVYQEVILE